MSQHQSAHGASRSGWWSRSSLATKLFIVTTIATVVVMAVITIIMGWQNQQVARQTVHREMAATLEGVDRSLQLAYSTASERAAQLIPVLERELGGRPVPDGSADDAGIPLLIVYDTIINGDIGHLLRMNENTGADPAVIVKAPQGWVRVATLLRDAQGEVRLNSVVEPGDLLARTLDSGQPYGGLVQRGERWYAMSILPLANDAGEVYAGFSVRVDVHDQVTNVLQMVSDTQVAEFGALGLLGADSAGRPLLMAHGAGATLGEGAAEAAGMLAPQFEGSNGFAEIQGPDGEAYLASWQKVDNWGWTLYGVGRKADFMAQSLQALIMQTAMMIVGTLLISLVVGWLAARTLRPVRDIIERLERLGKGDLTGRFPPMPPRSRNEVHTLYD